MLLCWISELGWFNCEQYNRTTETLCLAPSFNWHPLLMSFAFPILMTEAVLIFKSGCCLRNKIAIFYSHFLLHLASLICFILGVVMVFKYHDGINIGHFLTSHSWMGFFVAFLFAFQFVVSFWSYYLKSPDLNGIQDGWQNRNAALTPYHKFFGLVIYLTGMATCCMGLAEKHIFIRFEDGQYFPQLLALNIAIIAILAAAHYFDPTPGKGRTSVETDKLLAD